MLCGGKFSPKVLTERSYSSVHAFQVFTLSKILFQNHTNHQHNRRTWRAGTHASLDVWTFLDLKSESLDEAQQWSSYEPVDDDSGFSFSQGEVLDAFWCRTCEFCWNSWTELGSQRKRATHSVWNSNIFKLNHNVSNCRTSSNYAKLLTNSDSNQ